MRNSVISNLAITIDSSGFESFPEACVYARFLATDLLQMEIISEDHRDDLVLRLDGERTITVY
jgi:hypothetical protein